MKSQSAILGGAPQFEEPLHVGRPGVGDLERLRERIDGIRDRRGPTKNGPEVQESERAFEERLGVAGVIAVCNGTLGLEIATRAADATRAQHGEADVQGAELADRNIGDTGRCG